MLKIEVGTKIQWSSGAGILTGTVKKITLSPNAMEKVAPWLIIKNVKTEENRRLSNTMLCGRDQNLKMMKVRVL